MSSVVANLFTSWTFWVGLLVGFVLSRAWCGLKAWRHHRPVRPALTVDMRHVGALLGVAFMVWSVVQTNANADESHQIAAEAQRFAAETRQCQQVLITAIRQSRQITTENDAESEAQRDALAGWLRALLNPPPEIARLDGADPARQQYAIGVTERTNAAIDASQDRQRQNEARRAPLPDPDCGR
ncbi:hypothetical protein ACQ856_18045 [Mycolicibacterium psychrotolerans]|uniref:hypothetical protein n=1 Tax=Mycolicibacterium psychrotolerans TaxID=216929 RepID=UPI003D6664FB